MSIDTYPFSETRGERFPPVRLAIFHLQDVCVRIPRSLRNHLRTASLELAPQIEATFRWLRKRQVRIALLSDFDEAGTNILLERLSWELGGDQLIQAVVPEQGVGENPIRQAMDLAGVSDPHQVTLIADTPDLLNFGTQAQVRLNLGVTSGKHSYEVLNSTPCRALLDNTIQIVNYLLDEVPQLAAAGGAGSNG
ncbi:HAD family hydrolase [Lewinella sp. 4G2]|uniref:HAD family hydrolase n=1 Tax=Lewinella sp. 4G2 TaxID=1803372 RepID=UPI0007B4AA6D|nr:hypothetical protein [Lewinella sp. 4G2]OAV44387.1 hypothetical protein A3850_007720 [Lewinella sp. 4G2]